MIVFTAILLAGCQGNKPEQKKEEGMEKFVEDEAFKEAHDEPSALEFQPKGELLTFETPDGATGSAYALKQETPSDKYLLVIHEWWGLNDHIRQEAERLFAALPGVNVLALDMYDGKVADNREDAGRYMQAATEERGEAIVSGVLNLAGENARVATIGWCFGGGWSLKSSILAADRGVGCVMYYGMPVMDQGKLAPLQADVLGIFAEQDGWITPEVADNFAAAAKEAGKKLEIHQFDAKHAFANPSSDAYLEKEAQEANRLALEFLSDRFSE